MLSPWSSLSLAQQVAQMVVVRASGYLFNHQIQYPAWEPDQSTLHHWVHELGVGGVIVLGGSALELRERSRQLQGWATIPLLLAADIEEGVGQRFPGATWFPPPMALGAIAQRDQQMAIALSEEMGRITAQEASAIGLNWILAPVVDVNNNPDNPVINVRSFAETPDQVSKLATAFIRGTQSCPVLTTAKHFPGHGDTATDSHLTLPVLPHDRQRLDTVEFPPFQAAIAQKVDAVMTAHVHLPILDDQHPATLSQAILTEELRQRLGFSGLIVTDALIMGAIAQHYGDNEAAVRSVEAGSDIVLMPADPPGAIQAICQAVEQGRIDYSQIEASLTRIWQAKQRVVTNLSSAHQQATSSIDSASTLSLLSTPSAQVAVQKILQHSLQQSTGDRRPNLLLPLASSQPGWNLIVVDDVVNCPFLSRISPAIAYPKKLGYHLRVFDYHQSLPISPNQVSPEPTILQLFIRGNPFRSSADITAIALKWIQALVTHKTLNAAIVYGSPYVFETVLNHLPETVPAIFSYGQMPAAQAIALNRLIESASIEAISSQPDTTFTD